MTSLSPYSLDAASHLNRREQQMLMAYGNAMHAVCSVCWPEEYRRLREQSRGRSEWQKLPDSKQTEADTRNLMLTLAVDPLLGMARQGLSRPKEWQGWANRLHASPRWMAASPFYGAHFIRREYLFPEKRVTKRHDWLEARSPATQMLTLYHDDVPANGTTPYASIESVMARARARWRSVVPQILDAWALGGLVWWDVSPRGRASLAFHLHVVGEPYMIRGRRKRPADDPRGRLEHAWAQTAVKGEARGLSFADGMGDGALRVAATPENTARQLTYASGFWGLRRSRYKTRLYPKLLRGFDPERATRVDSGTGVAASVPTANQLRLIHAAFVVSPPFSPRWFGLWNLVKPTLRNVEGRSRSDLLVNSVKARPLVA